MFGSILGTLQKFRADETKDKDREQKRRKIETKIDQKTEKERAEAIKQKQELFEDKKKKEMEIKVLQVIYRNNKCLSIPCIYSLLFSYMIIFTLCNVDIKGSNEKSRRV